MTLQNKGISRRDFTWLLGAGTGAAVLDLRPSAAGAETAAAAAAKAEPEVRGVVRLSANENPYGPCPGAVAAMREALASACRYPFETETALREEVARLHGVSPEEVLLGNGSSEVLELCVASFCDSANPVVVAQPTFEAVLMHARAVGDKAQLVPLTNDSHHDLPKMLAAANAGGLVYLCNPNNPTGTITPKADVRSFLARVPERVMVVVDEAYLHYVESDDYESVMPLMREHPNLIVTRTFSKIYGMAGVRCGYAVAGAPTISRLRQRQAFNNLNLMAIAGARESLKDGDHVARGRRLNQTVRTMSVAELATMGYRTLPSEANFFMVDLRRPAPPVIAAFREHGIAVGRPFPALPTFLRVTVGTAEEMRTFLAAFRQVMA